MLGITDDSPRTAAQFARAFGYPIPAAIDNREKIRAEVDAALHAPAVTTPRLPPTPKNIRGALCDVAMEQMTDAAMRTVGKQWLSDAELALTDQIRSATPAWTTALTADYATLVNELRTAAAQVQLGTDPTLIAADLLPAWHAGVHIAATLDQRVQVRQIFGRVLGEHSHGVANAPQSMAPRLGLLPYYGIVRLPTPGSQHQAALTEWQSHFAALEAAANAAVNTRWQTWLDAENEGWLYLSMPGPGELTTRLNQTTDFANVGVQSVANDRGAGLTRLLSRADATYQTVATAGV